MHCLFRQGLSRHGLSGYGTRRHYLSEYGLPRHGLSLKHHVGSDARCMRLPLMPVQLHP